ncbi:MAG: hypothetical protein ACD_79C01430G0001 [uncultured bacterium]|nr:MAG: hypothetical protein ACD_79C01430G0001 [uncultured bacterium]
MKDELFNQLSESIKEAGAIIKGHKKPGRIFHISPVSIKNIRTQLHISQIQFAHLIGVNIDTIQNWEQGRRKPRGAAKALLTVAAKNPKAVLEALNT